MRIRHLIVITSILSAGLFSTSAARAAGPYTIAVTSVPGASVLGLAFTRNACSNTIVTSPLNGSDGHIVNVSAFSTSPPTQISITWTGIAAGAADTGGLTARYFSSGCIPKFITGNTGSGPLPGTWKVKIPTGTKWMLLDGWGVAQVSFTFKKV